MIPDMSPEQMFGYLIAAISILAGVVGWLHRDTMKRSDRQVSDIQRDFAAHKEETKETIKILDSRLYESVRKESDARLEAMEAKWQARQPCALDACPRRMTFSVVDGPKD